MDLLKAVLNNSKEQLSPKYYNRLMEDIETEFITDIRNLNAQIFRYTLQTKEDLQNNVNDVIEGNEDKIKAPESLLNASQEQTPIYNKQDNNNTFTEDKQDNINIDAEKEAIKKEAQEQKEQQQEQLKELTPQKGIITNENFDFPINTHPDNMTSKNVDYDLLGALTLKSKFGGNLINHNGERYIYKNQIDYTELANTLNKSEATVKRLFNKLIKSDTNIISVGNSKNGIFYTLSCKTNNKYYTLINHKQLYQMLSSFNPDVIKLYLVIKIKWDYEKKVNKHQGKLKLSNDFIGAKMGYKVTNGTISGATKTKIASMTNTLETMGFITKELRYETIWDEEQQREITRKRNYYTVLTYEEWAIKNPKEAKLKYNNETGEYYFPDEETEIFIPTDIKVI